MVTSLDEEEDFTTCYRVADLTTVYAPTIKLSFVTFYVTLERTGFFQYLMCLESANPGTPLPTSPILRDPYPSFPHSWVKVNG